MTAQEAVAILGAAKHVMNDMGGLMVEAGQAENAECLLYRNPSRELAHQLADSILPPGKRGHVRLVLYPPQNARATAFLAAVLRAVR